MGSTDVREPIPNGFVKLVGFIILVAGATFLAWMYAGEALAAAIFIGLFATVRLVHPQGWTDWVREYWKWNVKGVAEYIQKDDEGLRRVFIPYWKGLYTFSYPLYPERPWSIIIRRSGWSFLRGWVRVGSDALDKYWSIRQIQTTSVWDTGEPFCPTTKVRLRHKDGTCLDLPVEEALDTMKALTVIGHIGYAFTTTTGVEEVLSFNNLLAKPPASSSTATSTNGTA